MGQSIRIDPEEVRRFQEEIDMPKPKKYIAMLWQPVAEKLMEKYGDVIADIHEVPRWSDGGGDAFFDVLVRDGKRVMEIDRFLSAEEYRLLMDYGVSLRTYVALLNKASS